MCYENTHHCKYCGNDYHCSLPNRACPTINFDIDEKMCDSCRTKIERDLREMDDCELKKKIREGI